MSDSVESHAVEVQRIIRSGTIWTASGVLAPAIGLGPLVASGWRPTQLPLLAAIPFWIGVIAAAVGLALLIWAGCPALGFPLDQAWAQKVVCIRVGCVTNVSGMAVVALAILLSPAG